MSGEGPESIPTSADPRSRRPAKKRALSPASAQAASVKALFARPDREIRLPRPVSPADGGRAGPRRPAPPEIITNVQGSSAGAGSGEFHVYKASRRREYERLRDMDADLRRQQHQEHFDDQRAQWERRDADKTRKNRDRRDKVKARKARAKDAAGPAPQHPQDRAITARDDGAPTSPVVDRPTEPAAVSQEPGLVIHDHD